MILRSPGCNQGEALAASNAAKVSMEFGCARDGNEGAPIFGAEDTMNEIACIRVRHLASSLRDSPFYNHDPYPTLKRGAKKHGACGARDYSPSTRRKIASTFPNCRV
jgi:hypothetical protein